MYSFYVLTLAYRSLRISLPSSSSLYLFSTKNNIIKVTKMTKIPLGVPKYFQLLYNSFFIIFKLIALGIIGIGQAMLKLKF